MEPDQAAILGFRESPIAQFVLSHRRIIECNKRAESLFGYNRSELVGQSVRMLYPSHADFQRIGEKSQSWMNSHATYIDERFMQARNGEIMWIRASGVTLSPEMPFNLTIWSFEKQFDYKAQTIKLTTREKEIAQHIVNGRTSKEIAGLLGISHRTVEVHRARLMKKFNVNNTVKLVSEIILISSVIPLQ